MKKFLLEISIWLAVKKLERQVYLAKRVGDIG